MALQIFTDRFNDFDRVGSVLPDGADQEFQQVVFHIRQEVKLIAVVFVERGTVDIRPLAELPDGDMINILRTQDVGEGILQQPPGHRDPAVFLFFHTDFPFLSYYRHETTGLLTNKPIHNELSVALSTPVD